MDQADIPASSEIADASAHGDVQRMVALAEKVFYERIPFNVELGLAPVRTSLDEVVTCFRKRPELVGNYQHDILHGGVIAAVIDSAAGMLAFLGMLDAARAEAPDAVRERFSRIGTIDMRIDYLRPAQGEQFTVTARSVRRGRRVAVVRADLANESGALIATGTCTYIVG